jgi:hypothetical protein
MEVKSQWISLGVVAVVSIGALVWWQGRVPHGKAGSVVPAGSVAAAVQARESIRFAPLEGASLAPHAETRSVAKTVEPPEVSEASDSDTLRVSARTRFVDEQGRPLAGVELLAAGRDTLSCRSGADGWATLELDPHARPRWVLEARCRDRATERRAVVVHPGDPVQLGDWRLVLGGVVEGRVTGPDGRGLPQIDVACLGIEYQPAEWGRSRSESLEILARPGAKVQTGEDGFFRLEAIPAGSLRLVACASDRLAAVSEQIEVPAGGTMRGIEIAMGAPDGGTGLSGTVLDPTGEPVAHAEVEVRSGNTRHRLTATDEGRFELRLRDQKPCDLTARDPAGLHRPAALLGARPGSRNLTLRLEEAPPVEVRVRSDSGQAIERFAVTLVGAATVPGHELGRFPDAVYPDGVLEFGAPSEDFLVEVRAHGWKTARLGPFSASAPLARVDCTLAVTPALRGTVSARGVPVPGATIDLHRSIAKNDRMNGFPLRLEPRPQASATSGPDGAFVLSVEDAGRYVLLVDADGFATTEVGPLTLDPGIDHVEQIELDEGGTLAIRVRSHEPRSLAGLIVAFSRGDGRAFTARTDEAGEVRAAQLSAGRWQVELASTEIDPDAALRQLGRKGPEPTPSNCQVHAGEVTHVVLWLDEEGGASCRLSGQLLIDGVPAEGIDAALEGSARTDAPRATIGEAGTFYLETDEPGDYRLRLRYGGDDPGRLLVILDSVHLSEGTQFWSLEIRTATLEGWMTADSGGSMLFHRWSREPLQVLASVIPDATGRFLRGGLPAGRGDLVLLDPNRPFEAQELRTVRTFELQAGVVNHLDP